MSPRPGVTVCSRWFLVPCCFAELKNVALPIINAALQDVTLPNMNLQEHVPVLGHISLDLSNMKVTGFRLPSAVLAVSSPPQFTMDMSGTRVAR